MRAREARMSKSLVYCIITTSRESARRDSLMAAISPAPPGIVPRNAVAMSRRVWRGQNPAVEETGQKNENHCEDKDSKMLGQSSYRGSRTPPPHGSSNDASPSYV